MLRTFAVVCAMTMTCAGIAAAACQVPLDAAAISSGIASGLNQERRAAGLPDLAPNDRLARAAAAQACHMAEQGVLAHEIKGKPGFRQRIKGAGYRMLTAVENIGRSDELSSAAALRMWRNSPGHQANTLNRSISEIGVAVTRGADGKAYYVFVGGQPQ